MLQKPHTNYSRIFVYYLSKKNLPPVSDPDLIGIWIEDDTSLYFFHRAKEKLIENLCKTTGAEIVYKADLDYKDWEAGVEITSFETNKLCIKPIWEKEKFHNDKKQILLDPSVIFGSGFHATTRLCLETLENLIFENSDIKSVLDLGTGTGLLAIAAAKMGAKNVLAIDNNPLACEVCQKNIELNSSTDVITVQNLNLLKNMPDIRQFDLVIANLYKGLLVKLFSDDRFWTSKYYMISGFIPSMKPELLQNIPAKRLKMLYQGKTEQWHLWLMKNQK